MRFITITFVLLVTSLMVNAQTAKNGIAYKLIGVDYQTPLQDAYSFDVNNLNKGAEISYSHSLTDAFDLVIPFRLGTAALPGVSENGFVSNKRLFMGLDATLRFNFANGFILPQSSFVQPYIIGGAGLTYFSPFDNKFIANLPLGAGIDFALRENLIFQTQAEYRFLNEESYVYSAGFKFLFGEQKQAVIKEAELPMKIEPVDKDGDGIEDGKDACPEVAGLAKFAGCPDTDKDGVEDAKDECPNIVGLVAFKGCPDTDGDGIKDSEDKCPDVKGLTALGGCPDGDSDNDGVPNLKDKCPNVAGVAALGGCPIVDTDGDGVADSDDKCPKLKGLAKYAGCPDTDGDGVADNVDKCPTVAGSASEAGCPIIKKEEIERINFVTKSIQFETGKNALKKSSYNIMDEVAAILIKYPNYNVSIEGHTDNTGNDANNMRLSENRAKACYDYLISKGVSASSMSYKGYGETSPIADNSTPAGRQMNRRVEFKLTQK